MLIKIKVHPSSGKQEIIKKSDEYIIYLKSPTQNNKANLETLKLLQRYFKVKNIRIKSGLKSKNKIIELT